LRWAISRHFRTKGLEVSMTGAKTGNAVIDGEVTGKSWRMALEIKSGHHDAVGGIGQLVEALSHSYKSAALVTSLRHARHLDSAVFQNGLVLLGVDSKARIHRVYP
jgi:hypothetical protein